MSRRNSNPENSHNTGPATPELDLSTREGVLENYRNQMNRMHQVGSALGKGDYAWEDAGTQSEPALFSSGQHIRMMYEKVEQNPLYQPDENDQLIARFVSAEIAAVIADNSIDSNKLRARYPDVEGETDDAKNSAALLCYLDETADSLKKHNTKIRNKLNAGEKEVNGQKIPFSNNDIGDLTGNIQANFAIIGDVGELRKEANGTAEKVHFSTFVQELEKFNSGKIDSVAFEQTKADFELTIKSEERVARALALATTDEKIDLVNDDFIGKVAQEPGVQAAIESQRKNVQDAADAERDPQVLTNDEKQAARAKARTPAAAQLAHQIAQRAGNQAAPGVTAPTPQGKKARKAAAAGTTAPIPGGTAGAQNTGSQNQGSGHNSQQQGTANPNTQSGNGGAGTNPNAANAGQNTGNQANASGNQQPAAGSNGGNGNNGNQTPPQAPTPAPGPSRGTATRSHGANLAPMNIPGNTADLQRNNVNAAARVLAESGRRRSINFSQIGDDGAHYNLQDELRKMMEYEKPDWFDEDTTTDEERVLYANQYIAHYYAETVRETVDGMAGEKDEKKRKRNRMVIRFGLTAVGFAVGGPGGAAAAGAIGLGITKAMDSEYKNRKKLYSAVNEYMPDNEINALIANVKRDNGGNFDLDSAFELSAARIQEQFEKGVVKKRQRNIGFAGLKGLAWTGGTLFGIGQVADAAHVMGDTAFQWVSQASWQGTGASWSGGLNPNFNYTMHEKPVSWKILEGLYKTGTGNW